MVEKVGRDVSGKEMLCKESAKHINIHIYIVVIHCFMFIKSTYIYISYIYSLILTIVFFFLLIFVDFSWLTRYEAVAD